MPTYHFQGRNREGEMIKGTRLAQNSDTLAAQLLKEGIVPVKIDLEELKQSPWADLKARLFEKNISIEELSTFARQMNTLSSSGVPLAMAIKQLAQTTRSHKVSQALFGIVENLESGKDLASSMQKYPKIFNPLMVNMVRIGQNSGRLDEAFLYLHQYLELEASSLKQIKTTTRYPMFVLISIFVAIMLVNIFVIPTFAKVFMQNNIPLPGITSFLVAVSTFIRTYIILILLFFGILIGSIYYYLKTPDGKYRWDKYKFHLPFIGSILKQIIMLRFAQSFAIVVKSGIPLVEGLNLVADAIQNEYARKQLQAMQAEIQRGKTLTQAALSITLFTPLELQMFAVSEETGELSNMLDHLSLYYQREVDYNLKRLGDIIEPVLIIGLAVLILGLALAVYMPIWNLVKIVH